ncbi:MAG: Crp/Fnr family transcriptional regulator [Gammaproteobacteria bacterium]
MNKVKSLDQTLIEILNDPSFQEGTAWRRQRFHIHDIIVREGDNGHTLFYIEEGSLRVTGHIDLEQKRHIQPGYCDLHSGDIFGEICLNEIHRRTATVTAISEGCIVEIEAEKLNAYFDKHPKQGYLFYKQLFAVMIERMKSANQRVGNLLAWGLKAHGIEQHL